MFLTRKILPANKIKPHFIFCLAVPAYHRTQIAQNQLFRDKESARNYSELGRIDLPRNQTLLPRLFLFKPH
jgi:hypothetical protein